MHIKEVNSYIKVLVELRVSSNWGVTLDNSKDVTRRCRRSSKARVRTLLVLTRYVLNALQRHLMVGRFIPK